MLSDLEIAQAATLRPITDVAIEIGIAEEHLELYGRYKAKVSLDVLEAFADRPQGRYIDVTAINPTPLGEGKTVTTVGLGQALGHIGKKVITCIRQPSLGPVFGIKGGAAGGGYSQVIPMEDFNLHLTGDVHAVSMANNLLAAYIDNHIFHGNALDIDPYSITWRRVVDLNDRNLRNVVTGLGGKLDGRPRETGFDIAVASEVMAVLAMASDLQDMRARLGRIVIGTNSKGEPVTAEELKCAGAMTVLMRDAIKPNLLQNLEGGAVFVHAGPFANIAQGNNSVIADRIALALADYVVTESGFGADMGAEKFLDIKCRASGLRPDCAVIVATVRALKAHSGKFEVRPGKPLDERLKSEDLESLAEGIVNLEKHVENMKKYGIPVVVAVNHFPTDTEAEHDFIKVRAREAGADFAVTHRVHAGGGEGGAELAEAVVAACELPEGLPLPVSRRRPHQREDRGHRDRDLRRRRRRLPARGRGEDQALHGLGPRQAADLHGQDPSVAVSRPRPEGPPDRLASADPRHPCERRRRIHLPALRGYANHARPAQSARRRRHRHRRRRPSGGAVLDRAAAEPSQRR